jgi:hypothetical protein
MDLINGALYPFACSNARRFVGFIVSDIFRAACTHFFKHTQPPRRPHEKWINSMYVLIQPIKENSLIK